MSRPRARGSSRPAGRRERGAGVSRILWKLGLRDRVQAVILAYEAGIVRPGEGPVR